MRIFLYFLVSSPLWMPYVWFFISSLSMFSGYDFLEVLPYVIGVGACTSIAAIVKLYVNAHKKVVQVSNINAHPNSFNKEFRLSKRTTIIVCASPILLPPLIVLIVPCESHLCLEVFLIAGIAFVISTVIAIIAFFDYHKVWPDLHLKKKLSFEDSFFICSASISRILYRTYIARATADIYLGLRLLAGSSGTLQIRLKEFATRPCTRVRI